MVNVDKCKKCYSLGLSCCSTTPIWKEEELAEFNFKSPILGEIDNVIKISYLREYNGYVITKREDVKGGTVSLTNPCIFLNEEGTCNIYEYRPEHCKIKGSEKNPCEFYNTDIEKMDNENIAINLKTKIKIDRLANLPKLEGKAVNFRLPTIRKFSNKDLKNLKEDMLLYLILNSLNKLRDSYPDNEYIKFKYEYNLILTDVNGEKAMNSVRHSKAYTDIIELKSVVTTYNKLHRRFVLKDPMYIDVLTTKLNKILNGISFISTGLTDKDIINYVGSFLIPLDIYKSKYKNKKVKDLVKEDELYLAKKWLYKKCGSDSLFQVPEVIEKMYKNAEMIYKAVLKQK